MSAQVTDQHLQGTPALWITRRIAPPSWPGPRDLAPIHGHITPSPPPPRHPLATNSLVFHQRHLDDYGATNDMRRYIPRNEIDHESFFDRTRIIPRQAFNVRVTWNGDALK